MTLEIISLNRHCEEKFAPAAAAFLNGVDFAPDFETPQDLLVPMRQLRRRSNGVARWLALAVVTGTITALAFVNYFA
ncbi:MAG: hypothetical protein ACREQC_13940, partial [Candidatus Binataceae bacterium]